MATPTEISRRRDMEAHVLKVRQRVEREDLSHMELMERHRDKLAELTDRNCVFLRS